jgi:pimeloyl-ACP methyl ester carboxylesterase
VKVEGLSMRILLVHGLGRTPLSMWRFGHYLRRAGVEPRLFGYVPAMERFDRIAGRLQREIEQIAEAEYAVVGHSLGGLFLRAAVARLSPGVRRPKHMVMLGTPNQSSRMARRFQRWLIYRMISGDAGQLLASPARVKALPVPSVPLTVIAGTRGPTFRWGVFPGEVNDGLVSVSETRLDGHEEHIELPIWHSFMMNHPRVRQMIRDRCLGGAG